MRKRRIKEKRNGSTAVFFLVYVTAHNGILEIEICGFWPRFFLSLQSKFNHFNDSDIVASSFPFISLPSRELHGQRYGLTWLRVLVGFKTELFVYDNLYILNFNSFPTRHHPELKSPSVSFEPDRVVFSR